MKITILGAGIGGMSAAALLAHQGFDVKILEQNANYGGKAGQINKCNYIFDTGPSLLTFPEWIDELFEQCNKNPRDYFDYFHLDKITRYFFKDESYLDVTSDLELTSKNFEKYSGLESKKFLKYFKLWEKIYEISERTFLKGEMTYNLSFFKNAFLWFTKAGVRNIFSSMANYNSNKLENKNVEQIMNRFATYTGSSPYKTPAFMNQLAVVEMIKGAYFPKGGMFSIPSALYQLCIDLGVSFSFNEKVCSLKIENNGVLVQTENESYYPEICISNIDYFVTQKLMSNNSFISPEKLSTSAIVFYWGIKSKFNQLELHNILFSEDYRKEFSEIFDLHKIPDELTIYINITSKLESSHAPEGCENWFVMVNIPPRPDLVTKNEIQRVKKFIIKTINLKLKTDIEKLIEFEKILTPNTLYKDTGAFNGALYGDHQNSLHSIINRKKNEDNENKNMFYVGGSVHPGGGIPLALRSGVNTAEKIKNAYKEVSIL